MGRPSQTSVPLNAPARLEPERNDGGERDRRGEVAGKLVVACGDAAEVLARENEVPLIRRSAAMRFLFEQRTDPAQSRFGLQNLGYHCTAEHVAHTVMLSLNDSRHLDKIVKVATSVTGYPFRLKETALGGGTARGVEIRELAQGFYNAGGPAPQGEWSE